MRYRKTKYGFYEIRPRPSIARLKSYYASKYYQEGRGSYEVKYSNLELQWIRRKNKFLVYLARKYLKTTTNDKLSLLDVGCGEGFGMQAFKDDGWRVEGIDFSSEGLKQKNPRLLKYFQKGELNKQIEEKLLQGRSYNCVLLTNVLEHVLRPVELLCKIKKLVTKNSLLLITVPNDFSSVQMDLESKKIIKRRYWIAPPDHLQYFNIKSLGHIAQACDWNPIVFLADFPIDWFLYHVGSNYINNPKLGKAAHHARIMLEMLLMKCSNQKVFDFRRSLAEVGMGRDLTVILRNCL